MDLPPKPISPSASSTEGAIGYLDVTIKKPFSREEQIKIAIPPQGIREPKATSQQKAQLMEFGITNPAPLQHLGSGQAGYIIDQILIARKQNGARFPRCAAWIALAAAVVGAVFAASMLMNANHEARNQSAEASAAWTQRNPNSKAESPSPIPGLSPQKLYDMLGLQERGFSFEPPEPPITGNWKFKLSIDGKTYEITVHSSNSHSVEWVEVKIDVMQGYDINELTQSFFGSVASMGSTSESALAAQNWVKEHINKKGFATFGALDFEITSDSSRQRKLVISAAKSPHLDPDMPPGKPPK
jgi:hypothetical protein